MDLYVVFEGILAKTKSGKGVPESILDMEVNLGAFEWIAGVAPENIVILSNQTWIYSSPGIGNSEKFWAKLRYVSEALREFLESRKIVSKVYSIYSKRKAWTYGFQSTDPSLIDQIWIEHPELQGRESMFLGRPMEFDLGYARRMGFKNIQTWSQ